jgi:hypothetical protein
MKRDPLIRILFILPLLLLGGCGDDPPPPFAPPGPPAITAVRVFPPRSVLRAAPEVLVIQGDSVRFDAELGQDFMPGDDWGSEEGGEPGEIVGGEITLRPRTPGMAITDAWLLLDEEVVRMRPGVWPGPGSRPPDFELGVQSTRGLGRLGTIDVVVRVRTALGETRLLQRRGVEVMIVE